MLIVALLAIILFVVFGGFLLSALLFHLIPWIILGLIAGWVGSKLVGANTTLFEDMLAGIAGSVIAGALYSLFTHTSTGSTLSISHILVSIVGAAVLLGVHKTMNRPSSSSSMIGS